MRKVEIPEVELSDNEVNDGVPSEVSSTHGPRNEEVIPSGQYKVQKGESLYHVAKRFNMKMTDLREMNKLKDFVIHEGDILVVAENR